MKNDWYKHALHRSVVDMHITDNDDRFLSQFNPESYVDMMVLSKVESAVLIAHSVIGLCNYPTKIGEMHKGLKGRDILGELIRLCRDKDIKVVIYYSLVFDNWAYYNHPEWRIVDLEGKEVNFFSNRLKVVCPNNPEYRDFVVQRAEEVCRGYDFDGIRFDMTLWPDLCFCKSCRQRFDSEVGGELVTVVDWLNPQWVKFQRARERWINEFAELATSTVRKYKPEVTVEHQSSTYTFSWRAGITTDFSKSSDLLEGDFYGGHIPGSFACKLYYNLSDNLPFCYETSSGVFLHDHITLKSKELLETKICMALANGGAFLFIDAIDPVGTLNRKVYSTLGGLFEKTKVYEEYVGGQLCQDVAIYLSTESKIDFEDNGKSVADASNNYPHVDGAIKAAGALIHHNIPFGVVTNKNIRDLSQYRVLILPNVLMMDEDEVAAIREYVKGGGSVYASKFTSLTDKDGNRRDNFMLSDVFGVSFVEETKENFTYIGPTHEGQKLFGEASMEYPLSIYGTQIKAQATENAQVLGKIVLPFSDPKEIQFFASILNNPPGIATDYDAVVAHQYGKGRSLYVAGDLENVPFHEEVFIQMLRLLAGEPFFIESDAPKPVEITTFHQPEKQRYIVNLLNFQDQMPNLPVFDIHITMNVGTRKVKQVVVIPGEETLSFTEQEGFLEFVVRRLETFTMLVVQYQ